MKLLRKLDTAAAVILIGGAAYTIASGLLASDKPSKSRSRQAGSSAAYLMLGAAGAYSALRAVGPKTKQEQRLGQAAHWYDQAEAYYRQAKSYRQAAEKALQRFNNRRNSGK